MLPVKLPKHEGGWVAACPANEACQAGARHEATEARRRRQAARKPKHGPGADPGPLLLLLLSTLLLSVRPSLTPQIHRLAGRATNA